MAYMFVLLGSFIIVLFLMQLVFFEITRSKMKKNDNISWFLSLKKPFHYNRLGYMIFICFICYLISSPAQMFTVEWFIFFILFVAMGVVADAVVQYLILAYSKKRCRNDIAEADLLQNELTQLSQTMMVDEHYEETQKKYDEESILKSYLDPTSHLAIVSVDGGEFARRLNPLPEATFVIEPYVDLNAVKAKFENTPVKVTELTPSGQMPFKDEKMDIVMCMNSNYEKEEMKRVLKPNGYFIVNQNGTANYKEFLKLYMPFGMKGAWDAYSCAGTLESIGMRIVDKFEDYGTIRFHSVEALYTFFKKVSPDIANVNKYQLFYLKALQDIKKYSFFELTTHRFLVVAQKV